MIKFKAYIQLKSGLDGRSVMIYKTWPSLHQVFTKFTQKMNNLLKHWMKLGPLLSVVFDPKKS